MSEVKENAVMKITKMLESKINDGYSELSKLEITDEKYGTTINNLTNTIMLYANLLNAIHNQATANETEPKKEEK